MELFLFHDLITQLEGFNRIISKSRIEEILVIFSGNEKTFERISSDILIIDTSEEEAFIIGRNLIFNNFAFITSTSMDQEFIRILSEKGVVIEITDQIYNIQTYQIIFFSSFLGFQNHYFELLNSKSVIVSKMKLFYVS